MIFKTDSHPCVMIEVLTDVWVAEVVKTGVGVFAIIVRTDLVIGTLSGVQVDVIIDTVPDFGVEVLADVTANVLIVVAMTTLLFAMPSP